VFFVVVSVERDLVARDEGACAALVTGVRLFVRGELRLSLKTLLALPTLPLPRHNRMLLPHMRNNVVYRL
jgi:hypothetical protein